MMISYIIAKHGKIPDAHAGSSQKTSLLLRHCEILLELPASGQKHTRLARVYRRLAGLELPTETPMEIVSFPSRYHRQENISAPAWDADWTKSYAGFYVSREWRELRFKILQRDGRHCLCCGAGPTPGNILNVDHITPLSKAWERRLDPTNLQTLCEDCNAGKGARYQTDFRPT